MRHGQTLHGEQLGKHGYESPVWRRWSKRVARRKDRRMGRAMGEDAPRRRRYAGWAD